MDITLKLSKDFERCLEDLKKKYGEDFEYINGLHPSQLDYSEFLDKFVEKGTAEGQVINYKLGTLCEFFNIKLSNWHHADADTEACMKVFNELVKLSNGNLEIE